MGPSQRQLRFLSREDQTLYKKWLSRGLMIYGSLMAALVLAVVAHHRVTPGSSDLAGDPMQTAAITAKR